MIQQNQFVEHLPVCFVIISHQKPDRKNKKDNKPDRTPCRPHYTSQAAGRDPALGYSGQWSVRQECDVNQREHTGPLQHPRLISLKMPRLI